MLYHRVQYSTLKTPHPKIATWDWSAVDAQVGSNLTPKPKPMNRDVVDAGVGAEDVEAEGVAGGAAQGGNPHNLIT